MHSRSHPIGYLVLARAGGSPSSPALPRTDPRRDVLRPQVRPNQVQPIMKSLRGSKQAAAVLTFIVWKPGLDTH